MNKKYSLNFSHFSDYIHISDDALRHCQTQGLAYNRLCRSVGPSVCLSVSFIPLHLRFTPNSMEACVGWRRRTSDALTPDTWPWYVHRWRYICYILWQRLWVQLALGYTGDAVQYRFHRTCNMIFNECCGGAMHYNIWPLRISASQCQVG